MTAAHDLASVGWFSFEDRCVSSRPGRWRRELRPVLRGFAGRDRADDVLLAASELVSNGVEHAGGVTALRVTGVAGTVTVEVEDPMPCMVERSEERPERGRGLAITRAVADSWGWYSTDAGKVVWARFDARGAVTTATSRAPGRKAG
ncbi:MAG: ATP-binding protein [Candidatus Nanopelagicales bacterium]